MPKQSTVKELLAVKAAEDVGVGTKHRRPEQQFFINWSKEDCRTATSAEAAVLRYKKFVKRAKEAQPAQELARIRAEYTDKSQEELRDRYEHLTTVHAAMIKEFTEGGPTELALRAQILQQEMKVVQDFLGKARS